MPQGLGIFDGHNFAPQGGGGRQQPEAMGLCVLRRPSKMSAAFVTFAGQPVEPASDKPLQAVDFCPT